MNQEEKLLGQQQQHPKYQISDVVEKVEHRKLQGQEAAAGAAGAAGAADPPTDEAVQKKRVSKFKASSMKKRARQ